MNMKKGWLRILGTVWVFWASHAAMVTAAAENGYLTYQEPAVNSATTSMSTLAYVFSLLLTFAIVVGLAYFTSKYLSQRMVPAMQSGTMHILDVVSLGTNKALYLVEVGNRVFWLGVTDHSITHLQEFTDADFIAELRAKGSNFPVRTSPTFQNVFQQQIEALQRITGRTTGGGKSQ